MMHALEVWFLLCMESMVVFIAAALLEESFDVRDKLSRLSFGRKLLEVKRARLRRFVVDAVRGLDAGGVKVRVSYEQLDALVDAAGSAFGGFREQWGKDVYGAYSSFSTERWFEELREILGKQRMVSAKVVNPRFVKFFVCTLKSIAVLEEDVLVLSAKADGDSDVYSAVNKSLKERYNVLVNDLKSENARLTQSVSARLLNKAGGVAVNGGRVGSMAALAGRRNGELNPFIDSVAKPRDPARKVMRF